MKKSLIVSEGLNWLSVLTIITGISLIIVFISINAVSPNKQKQGEEYKSDSMNYKCIILKKD